MPLALPANVQITPDRYGDTDVHKCTREATDDAKEREQELRDTECIVVDDPDSGDTFDLKSGFPDCGTGGELVDGSLSTTANGATSIALP